MKASISALQGIKVLDLSRVLAGPLCAQMLGDYGADVLKVEPPAGDQGRFSGPPFVDGDSAMYWGLNRNKRGLALDLGKPEGREILLRLIADADVLVQNFKTGTMEKWGLGYEALSKRFPKLIMASISGFGATGPLGGTPGYDGSAAAWTGVIDANGELEGGPMRLGVSVVDVSAGLHAVIGILLALQARHHTGRGQHLDITLYDCAFPLLNPHIANWLQGGARTPRTGNFHPTFVPFGVYATRDAPIYLGVSSNAHFRSLCEVIGRLEWASDPRFRDLPARARHRTELNALVTQAFASESAVDLALRLNALDVPAGAILGVAEALVQEHTKHREMLVEKEGFVSLGLPIKLSETPGGVRLAPPAYGEHSQETLQSLGLTEVEIAALRATGISPIDRLR